MTDRRAFLGLAGAAALLPFAVRAATVDFSPPAGLMTFTRSLRRELGGGAAMSAARTFSIRFVPQTNGHTIEGAEVGNPVVEAPPSLEAFAKLERERRETGTFPIALDRAGLIVAQPLKAGSPQLDRAVDEALHRIAASGSTDDEQAQMRAFVVGLQQAATSLVAAFPADLFRPLSTAHNEYRDVALPDGSSGRVTLDFAALTDPASGLLREAERAVLTQLGGSERRTVERWSLTPA